MLCASREVVGKARRWRKVLGGGMRQAGVLAAAGIYALEHNIERLREDHDNARALAEGLAKIDEIEVAPGGAQTNMVFISVEPGRLAGLRDHLQRRDILVTGQRTIRLVTHLDVDREDIRRFVQAVEEFFTARA
jgi:threonine aldolase